MFSAIHFRTPGEERYLYMLENYDNIWHEATRERKASFFNLVHGHYMLRIRAINIDGVWSEKTLSIKINSPWWQRWWVITILSISFIGIVWGFIYYRSQRFKKENRLLEKKVAERTIQFKR